MGRWRGKSSVVHYTNSGNIGMVWSSKLRMVWSTNSSRIVRKGWNLFCLYIGSKCCRV
jgi:hypothetical protein